MKKHKILRKMEVYELLEKQMIILITVFGIITAICGFMAYRYGKLKSAAEEIAKKETAKQMKWTDENKDVAAVRFMCYSESGDLNFLYGTLHITKKTGGIGFEDGNYNIIAKESEIYLPVGSYSAELSTRSYKNQSLDIHITESQIGERIWCTFNLNLKK